MYRNLRSWWRALALAMTVGAAVAEVLAEMRRRRQERTLDRRAVSDWESEGGATPTATVEPRAHAGDAP